VVRTDRAPMCRKKRAGRLRGAPFIAVMETTDFRNRDNRPDGCFRDRSVIWRVFLEPEVRSTPMIVPAIGPKQTSEMRFVHDDNVIETLSSD
jgi:hypothetical protein